MAESRPEASRRSVEGEVQVRVEGDETGGEAYRIQVASLSRREAADVLRAKLAAGLDLPVVVRENRAASTFQVRVGAFESREEARSFALERLASAGYADFLVVREAFQAKGSTRRLAARGPGGVFLVGRAGFFFMPLTGSDFLRVNGKPYRGVLEVSLNSSGLITVVNHLGIEEYLFGVIPAEMNPARYPEFAALAAQSVAARTYALKNLGRFRSDGFDLTDDVRTQVYGGVDQERNPTNEVVRATAGLAIYFHGEFIDAMYTSTCGGRTEDFSKVYDAADVPYLRGVLCTLEQELSEPGSLTITAAADMQSAAVTSDGQPACRNLELAAVLGLTGSGPIAADQATTPPSAEEVRRWIDRSAALAGKENHAAPPEGGEIVSRAGFIRSAAASLFGEAEILRRVSPADINYYLGTIADQADIPAAARGAFAFLMQSGLWSPFPDNSARPQSQITRADSLYLLVRWLESARPGILRNGTFAGQPSGEAGANGEAVSVVWGSRNSQFRLARNLRLFRIADGRSTPVESIRLIGSERLRFHLGADNTIDFLEVELTRTGAANDRFSPVAAWRTTLKRTDLAGKLRGLADTIGEIVDLRPAETGTSGRVVRIELVGKRGNTIMNGYRFRNLVGLRDTLFTITRDEDPEGLIDSFTFHGRGWGHGVGLCQVGAYGMARAGRTYEEILKTYYQGVEIRRAY